MKEFSLIKHARGALGLRIFGMGPFFLPNQSLKRLQQLFNQEAQWARNRSLDDLKKMLKNSDIVITLWKKNELIGFGRATTDNVFRSVLWDIVISSNYQGFGLGKAIVDSLINDPLISSSEKIYLMTTNKVEFYNNLGGSCPSATGLDNTVHACYKGGQSA